MITTQHIFADGHLCDTDLDFLRSWQPNANLNEVVADNLTPQGEQDMRLLAKRLQSEFPEILRPKTQSISYQDYQVKNSNSLSRKNKI